MSTLPTSPTAALLATSLGGGGTHCPYRRTTDLLQRLAPGKMRIGFLIGAGCSLSEGGPGIPDLATLTSQIRTQLDKHATLKGSAEQAWSRLVNRGIPHPTVEDVLGHIRTLRSLCGSGPIDGFTEAALVDLDQAICEQVRTAVDKPLPGPASPFHVLARWIQAIPREYPVEIFTTNYDLSLEQALEEQRVPYFDGFVGSGSAFLDLESIAEDDLPPRWTRLWKMHGSINWWMTSKKKLRRSSDAVKGEQLLIYPSHLKYEESRQMPYYAMMDRLRVFLRSDQCVLLTCGYSFADEHINAYIAQGLAGNPNAACIGMIFGDRADAPKAIPIAKRYANLSLLAADGAIVGTAERDWHASCKDSNPAFALSVSKKLAPTRSKAPEDRCKWLLGDFAALGGFLTHQLSSRDVGLSDDAA